MESLHDFLNTLAHKGIRLSLEDGRLNCYAPKGALTAELRDGIAGNQAAIVALLQRREKKAREFPLSAGQKGLYILERLQPGTSAYNLPLVFRIKGDIRADLLARAWSCVLDRYPILTARVIEIDGTLSHRIDDECRSPLQRESIDFANDDTLLAFLRERAMRPFDLERGPLTRFELFTESQRSAVLLLTVHHLVFDGVSAIVVLRALFTAYQQLCEGKDVATAAELPGYQEFVAWEEAMLVSAEGAAHAAFWKRELGGELPALDLLRDLPRNASPASGSTLIEALPDELSRWLREFAKAQSLPPSVLFLALFQLLLHKCSNQDDIIVGMPHMGRPSHAFAEEVGYFINVVPVRVHCDGKTRLKEFLRKVKGTVLDALYHAAYPFPLMVDKAAARTADARPVFQVQYAYQNFVRPIDITTLDTIELEILHGVVQENYADLALEVFEDPSAPFTLHLKYDPRLYARETVSALFERYCVLLRAVREDADLPLRDYSVLTASERHKLLVDFNDTQTEYPKDKCIHDFFAPSDRAAVTFGDESLTYKELYDRCHGLALWLQAQGVGPDSIVGVCMERSIELMVAIMGTVMAGGAYMPLDPEYPEDRISYMLEDSKTKIVLTQPKFAGRFGSRAVTEWPVLTGELRREVKPHNLAYVIYTSGSTGRPKGVLNEHGALVNRIVWMQNAYQLTPADVVLQKTPYSFDVSVWEFFWPMMTGASVVFAAPGGHKDVQYLESLINDAKITTLHYVPSMLNAFLDGAQSECPTVRQIFASGEALDKRAVDAYRTRFPNAALHNLYGPTEAAIDVTAYDCAQLTEAFVPIGAPIANIQIYILDAHNNPQPIGVPGELHIAGDGLARGYLNRPELTEEKFVANPFTPGTRMYKTGDLARWLDDGTIQYLGRIDTQVKIRGFRIELGEIEARLNEHDAINDAVVIAQGHGADRQLIAFYRAKVQVPYEELRAHLLQTLPEYMVPAAFARVDTIPLNSNGKVDRGALSRMQIAIGSAREYVAPRNETERQLAAIWSEVLKVAKIGIHDNFFELGGHSLLATQVVSKIRTQLHAELPLKALFDFGTIAQIAQQIEAGDVPAIRPADRTQFDRLPLSFAQERLWFIQQFDPESAGYNAAGALMIRGELDVDRLERAFNGIIARHETLRTVFPSDDGRPYQKILDAVDFKLARLEATLDEAERLCRADAATPFDLAAGPLFRGKIIRLAEREHLLMLNMHHIISDGWSLGVLFNELRALMSGEELPPLPIQYADYSIWQRQWLEGDGVLERQLAYWQQKLAGLPESLELPIDHPRPAVQSLAGATHAFALDAQLAAQLKEIADQHGATTYMVLLAAFNALLYRYTGQNDLCVGSPIANRQYGETEGLIGMFVNTLALRSEIEQRDTFVALLAKVKATCLEAYEHQDAPFEKIVDVVRPQRNMAVSPLFQVMLILQNADMGAPDARIERHPLHGGTSQFDLTFEFAETLNGLAGLIEYSTALFEPQTVARMAAHFAAFCRAIVAAPEAKIVDVDYRIDGDKVEFNDTFADFPDKCVHELIANRGERIAVIAGDDALTYRELHARSERLALWLQAQGVEPDTLVGLCLERSLDMTVGLLAVLKSGGAYLPLDPAYPDERLSHMLYDSQTSIVLTQKSLMRQLRSIAPCGTRLVALDGEWPAIEEKPLRRDVQPHHLAYVIYTSGSTGQPKGVMVPHSAVVNHATYFAKRLALTPADRVLQFASLSFDTAAEEMFPAWIAGATLVLREQGPVAAPDDFLQAIERSGITLLDLPTAYWHELAGRSLPPSVRAVVIGGEAASGQRFEQWRRAAGDVLLLNSYGPTEGTIIATMYEPAAEDVDAATLPIGRPIANARVHVLDAQLQPVPVGVAGELCIGGAGVARGYWNRPELTAERFVTLRGERLYKTGDRVRRRADGVLEYLGRLDEQVKIRGFRIEPGEVEAALRRHASVRDAVVLARDGRLIAYVVSDIEIVSSDLKNALSASLPEFMIPAAFVRIDSIPKLPNGKLDRRALARMEVTIETGSQYVAPRNEIERQLAGIWSTLLHLEKVGIHDNFFELGGHSLLATQLVSKIRAELQVELPLKTLFEHGTIAGLVPRLTKSDAPVIQRADRTQIPLSYAQERLWFIHQLEPHSAGYNIAGAVRFRGALDVDRLEQAFNVIIDRHENLRTTFPSDEGRAQQVILDAIDFKLERIEAGLEEADELCRVEATTPFDLANGPLIRAKVIRIADDEQILLLNMHHIISDGWSLGVLFNELSALMSGEELPPLPIQYADYSVWQRQWLEADGLLDRQLAYWQEQLAGLPESLDLATDYSRPSMQSFAGATHRFVLDAQLSAQLERIAEEHGATLYMTLLAALNVLLHRYTGESDICIGGPIANRRYAETETLIGMFVNTLALRSRIDAEEPFVALLEKVKATCVEAYEHQDAPFEKVVDAVRPQRNMAITPLFQTMLVLQNTESAPADATIEIHPLDTGISKFDLTFDFTRTRHGLAATIEYCTALYKPQTIERMADHFRTLCEAIIAAPQAKVCELDYMRAAEEQRLLVDFNDTQAEYPKDKCIHDFFAPSERTAVTCGEESLTYEELYDRCHGLALWLQAQGVGPDSIVGVCMERSVELMVAIMGTVMAGGAYMPLDPEYPEDRISYMLEDSKTKIVLTQPKFAERFGSRAVTEWPVLTGELRREVKPHNLAYVIYTSGSTGRPKGVLNEHGALVNRIVWMQNAYQLTPADVVLQKTPYSFDVSVWEFFWPMMTGASVVFAAPGGHKDVQYLESLINDAKITTLHYVPSMLNAFLDGAQGECPTVRQIFASGEALDKRAVDAYRTRFPNAALHNLYGPTEAAIDVTAYDCSQLTEAFVPIGAPIANIQIYILDAHNNPQPIGVPGELHIAGDGLARGYLNRPELTEEKFVANPFTPGTRMYKTGDLARWLDDGTIQYLGRIDTQVKIRGFRIELGEIEARLNEHPSINDAVVIAQGHGADRQLIAFYRAKVQVPYEELRAHLLQTLPEYMVPAAFARIDAIPLSSNGKVDRRALARIDVTVGSPRIYVAPRNETERQLAAIWSEVLKVVKIGIHDNFFELGGHSLSAVQLMAKINRHFGQTVPLAILFTAPNIAALAKLLADEDEPSFDLLVPMQTNGDASPVFAIPGAGGNVLSLRPLVQTLGERQPLYGLEASSFGSVEETALANIAAMRSVQPHGPYCLIGHSYGGVVAYEMARMLLEEGEEISSLILLDSFEPTVMRSLSQDEVPDLLELRKLGFEIDAAQYAAFQNVCRANLLCYRTYEPQALPRTIDVTLYRATPDSALPPDYGWNALLQSPARVIDVEANHLSIIEKAQIHQTAATTN